LARLVLLLAVLAFSARTWQAELPRDLALLSEIKRKMAQNLSRVPNYTCLETISRGRRAPDRLVISVPGKQVPFRRTDVVRLEVAEVGGIELFAHAGEHNFENKDILEFAHGGLMGNGMFSSFAHDIFLTNVLTYKFVGEERLDGRTLLRFDFTVPQFVSGYRVGTNFGAAELGYHGSFWADPETFDAVHLEIIADDIPRVIRLTDVENRIDYAIVRIGSRDVLLPQGGELETREDRGWESRNQIAFTHCREYGVQSLIRFDNVTDSTDGTPNSATKFVELPAGVQLTLRLETPIDAATARVGDVISARVEADAKVKGAVVVPKDAVVSGRLRRLEVHKEGWPYVLAGLEFTEIEFEGKETRFFAELERLILPAETGPRRVESLDLPGVGVVTAKGSSLRLPKGTQMIWKTISYAQAAEIGK
jgi:hypothetical protein